MKNRKHILVDPTTHRELNILAARKGSNMQAEARVALSKYIQVENARLERSIEKKGAA